MSSQVSLPNHIKLTDGFQSFELQLQDGARGIAEGGSQASNLGVTGGGKRYGDGEPNFTHLEQRSYVGGRGIESFVDDNTRYYDGMNLWSLTPDKLVPAPIWKFASGIKTTDESLGVDRTWIKLIGAQRYISVAVGAITSADYANLWIRRVGSPGTLTLELRADSGGEAEGTLHQTVTKTISDVTDVISVFQEFDWTGTQTLSAGDHIKIYGASTDTDSKCWEVAVDESGTSSKYSSDASTWTSASFTMLYRLSVADTKRKWLGFTLEGAQYAVSVNDAGGASTLLINGGRGTASSGSTTTIVDSGIGWTADRFIGAWVKAIGGTGQGQYAQITDNTTDTLTFAAVSIAFDATTRYVIYKTPWWTELGTTGLGAVKTVAVLGNIAYFGHGAGDPIRRMYDNAGVATYADDGTNVADVLYPFYDAADGPQMWRAINGTTMEVSRASLAAWGTDLVFGTGIPVGSKDYAINNMIDYNNQLWVFKEEKPYSIQNDRAVLLSIGTEGLPGKETGQAVAVHNLFLWFSWWKSVERMYGGTVDDEGIWRGTGLPSGRDGPVSGLVALLPWLFQSIDAGSGTSSVYVLKDSGYHEMFRGFKAGHRVRNIFAQYNRGANPWLWISYNGELIYQEYSLTPLRESGFEFQHEAVMESAIMDMGHAETFKFFKDLSLSTQNLNKAGIRVEVEYQYGNNVNTSEWISATTLFSSPTDRTQIDAGETSRMKYRLRLITDDATTPPIVNASVLKGYEVTPVKRLWNVRAKVFNKVGKTDPDALYKWLWEASQRARKVTMYTVFPGIDNVLVKLEPPNTFWRFINKAAKWTGVMQLTLREM